MTRASERRWSVRDRGDNLDTRIPEGEQVRLPVIWLTELYTPTTLTGLLEGLPRLMAKARYQHLDRGDLVEWVQGTRRQGGGSWRILPIVRPSGGPHSPGDIEDVLPVGITSVTWGIYTLTSTVTAVTAAFHLQEDRAEELQCIVNEDVSTRASVLPDGGYQISDVRWQKQQSADRWRDSLRSDAAGWLADRLPGSFHRLVPGQLLTIELLLTEKQRPWDEPISGPGGTRGWMQVLDLVGRVGYWQCTSVPGLRLRGRRIHRWDRSRRNVLTLAALRDEFLGTGSRDQDASGAQDEAIYSLHSRVIPFANREALTALLQELDEQLASTRDLSERATSQRSAKALTQVQQQLISTGLDGQIVAADIAGYARDKERWRYDVLDFTHVVPPALIAAGTQPLPLTEVLRHGQIERGTAVARAEADLRDLINSSAQLSAAAENIRLQRSVRWLAIVSLIVAIVAAAATVAALHISSRPPATAPTTHPSPTRT